MTRSEHERFAFPQDAMRSADTALAAAQRALQQARNTKQHAPGWLGLMTQALAHVEAARRCIERS